MDTVIIAPKVSVIIPVFNNELFLREAIQSILDQSFRDFEIICIDDSSTDGSWELLNSINNEKLKIFRNEKNSGIAFTVNRAIALTRGELIARMDGDDISLPQRLMQQVSFMESHPDTDVVFSLIRQIDVYGNYAGEWKEDRIAITPEKIRKMMPKENCIAHPTAMFRKNVFSRHHYDSIYNVEDWALWLNILSQGGRIDKINEVLLDYRIHPGSTTVANRSKSLNRIISFQWRYVTTKFARRNFRLFDINVLKYLIINLILFPRRKFIKPIISVFKKIVKANPISLLFDIIRLRKVLRKIPDSSSRFFFFPFYHIGGAEKVHFSILESVADFKPIVFFTKVSDNSKYLHHFQKYAQCIDIGRLCYYPFFDRWTSKLISARINRLNNAVTFSSNSAFYYKLMKEFNSKVKCIDLIHAFVHQMENGPEHWSLPVVEQLSHRIFISQLALEHLKTFYQSNNVNFNLCERFVFIRNFVQIGSEPDIGSKKSKQLNVIYVGRGTPEKRVALIGKIAAKVKLINPSIQFTLIGNNESAVNHTNRNSCIFMGEISDPEKISNQLRKSDILLITSSREGVPLSIMEAMANGVLPISTNAGYVTEIIENGQNGLIVESSQGDKIVEQISELILDLDQNRGKLNSMRNNAYLASKKMFSKKDFIDSYRKILA